MAKWTTYPYPEPEFETIPNLAPEEYATRVAALRDLMATRGFHTLAVYGDRERFANLTFLTGYDPRFEEALLLVSADDRRPMLLVGNEGLGYAHSVAKLPDLEVVLCPTFSLPGQPRDLTVKGRPLAAWLHKFGVMNGKKVGLIGSKSFAQEEFTQFDRMTDLPSYMVMEVRDLAGYRQVTNATDILMHPSTGLRTGGSLTSAHEIALFEQATEMCYAGVRRLLYGLKEGMSEAEAAGLLRYSGSLPLSYHIALGFGENHVMAGLGSPDPSTKLKTGDPVTFGFGVRRGNVARTGFAAESDKEAAAGYIDQLAEPYFRCLKDWYESLKIGATGGQVYEAVKWFVEDPSKGVTLNPGHLLHLDEWPGTPFSPGSSQELRSGMFIQCDIIPAPGAPLFGIHTEDGLALADESLRNDLKAHFPSVAARIDRRRAMMRDVLGIQLSEDVLPLSSMQCCVCPFLLAPENILCG